MSSKIMMLRHGITEGNKNKWFYGALELPLLPEGKEKLRKQKEGGFYPETTEHTRFYTTGMIRTEETLEILFGDVQRETIPNMREMNFGEYEAVTFDEMKDDEIFQSWLNDEVGDVRFPGGESKNDFSERVRAGLEEFLDKHLALEESLGEESDKAFSVIICHGGVIAGIMHEFFPEERPTMWDWMPEPGCGYVVHLDKGKPQNHCQIGDLTIYYGKHEVEGENEE